MKNLDYLAEQISQETNGGIVPGADARKRGSRAITTTARLQENRWPVVQRLQELPSRRGFPGGLAPFATGGRSGRQDPGCRQPTKCGETRGVDWPPFVRHTKAHWPAKGRGENLHG